MRRGRTRPRPATNTNTGDAQFTGCSHGTFKGAEHTSVDVTNWWVAAGSAGPNTLFTDEVDTTTFRGQTDVAEARRMLVRASCATRYDVKHTSASQHRGSPTIRKEARGPSTLRLKRARPTAD
ncbi:hypothetical protein [Kribbella sp. NPDC004536]|uniref:hypothetical protein n=1 Tax=Kribbella sp. NPDC004536 TaxID=3364106 RepID=UPI0036C8B381